MRFDESAIPPVWLDAIDAMVDDGFHNLHDLGSAKYWEGKLSFRTQPCPSGVQSYFYLGVPGTAATIPYYCGVQGSFIGTLLEVPAVWEDITVHLAEYADAQMRDA